MAFLLPHHATAGMPFDSLCYDRGAFGPVAVFARSRCYPDHCSDPCGRGSVVQGFVRGGCLQYLGGTISLGSILTLSAVLRASFRPLIFGYDPVIAV